MRLVTRAVRATTTMTLGVARGVATKWNVM
jgi:hypothetical protein